MRFIELYESSSYLLLETPQRLAWLVANRGPKLLAKYEAEKTHGVIAMETSRHIDLMDGETPEEKLIKFIMSFDPTVAKNYSNWLCSRYMATPDKGGCRLEDFNASVTANLSMFERVSRSRRIANGNLDSYKSLQDLDDVIEPFREGDREVSNRADRAAGRSTGAAVMFPASDPMRTPEHVDVLLDDEDLLILQLKTETAARHFGENTNWCTTSGMFNSYSSTSPLYVLCDRKKNSRTQWHFNGSNSQFMNEKDRSIDLNGYLREHPKAFKVFHQQFLALLGTSTYGGQSLDANLFTPEDLQAAPVDTQVRIVKNPSDVDKLPAILTEEGFYKMALRRPSAKHNHYEERENGASFERDVFAKILQKYFKVLKPAVFIGYLMDERYWIWDYLPDKWKTEKVKNDLCDQIMQNNGSSAVPTKINIFFGEDSNAWTPHIYEAYYDAAADAGWDAENFSEKDFTDARMVKVLANNPANISDFHDRLNPKLVSQIIKITEPYEINDVFENLPAEYRNKESAKALHQSANQFKAKRDQHQRDHYLSALTHFDHEHWGTKGHRIAELSRHDFSKLPAQFQNAPFAARIVTEQPAALQRIPAAFVDQNVVNNAMVHGNWSQILEECDPHVVTPAMVLEAVEHAVTNRDNPSSHTRDEALKFPKVYKTYRPMLDYLLKHAVLPLNDEDWPKDAWTPENVVKKIRSMVRGSRQTQYSGYGFSSRRNNSYQVKESQKEWDKRFSNAWQTVPEEDQTPEIVQALVKEFPTCPPLLGESNLTGPILSLWMDATSGNHHLSAAEGKEAFEAFPQSAWSNPVLAQAIKRSYISTIPDEFKDKADPDTVIEMIMSASHYRDVDWSTVTSDMLTTAIGKSSYYTVIDRVPKDSPLLDDEKVVFAALRYAMKNDDSYGHYGRSSSARMLANIWPPEKRGHWEQRDWDLAGGSVVPWSEVPKQFRHDNLTVKTVLRDPVNLEHIPNPIQWLNENSDAITTAKGFKIDSWVSDAIYFDGDHWIDDKKAKHTEVGNGAYSVVKTHTGASIAYIYDGKGNLINGLCANLKSGDSYSGTTYSFTSEWNSSGDNKFEALRPFRDVIEAVVENYPIINEAFTKNYQSSLEGLLFYENAEGKLTKLEKLKREPVSENSKLTYVVPKKRSWGDTNHIIYDGEGPDAPMVAKILIDTRHGGGNKFESSKVYGTGADHIRWSRDLMLFLHGDGDIASGTGQKFKSSDLYRSCGIRGTGSFEWFTLFDEKIMEHGGMSIWRCGRVISIADDEHGLVATGKKAKDGSFTLGETFADVEEDKLHKIFSLMAGKL